MIWCFICGGYCRHPTIHRPTYWVPLQPRKR